VRDYPKVIWGLSTGIAIIDACVKSIIQLNQPTTDRISLHYLHTDMYLSILCSLSQWCYTSALDLRPEFLGLRFRIKTLGFALNLATHGFRLATQTLYLVFFVNINAVKINNLSNVQAWQALWYAVSM